MTQTRVTSQVRLISDVLCSGRFEVPWHQRYYDWTTEEVTELLHDLNSALENGKTCYFLGSIMLVKASNATQQRINDGQQRLITLSLLVAALCRSFAHRPGGDGSRETLGLRALFDRPANQTLRLAEAAKYSVRITPPKNDNQKFIQILRGHDIGTNGLLTEAWDTIGTFVDAMNRGTRKRFFDFIMQRVEVSVLDVPDEVDANLVFEGLNARGKPLDEVDLIRNRLYSYFSESDDATRRETVHGNLEATAVILRGKAIEEYFRCYLQCRYGYLQKTRFHRQALRQIEEAAGQRAPADYVFELVGGLGRRESIELFRTVTSTRPSQSLERYLPTSTAKRGTAVLLAELGKYKVSYPLVFALLHRFLVESNREAKRRTGRAVTRSLKNLTSFVMRTAFVAAQFAPSRFEEAFANCAKEIFAGRGISSLDVLPVLEEHDELNVMSDASFVRRMTEMEVRDSKKALQYLFGINAREQAGSEVLRKTKCSVEHVLPQSDEHWKEWDGFAGVNAREWVHRTGNLVIVAKGENRAGAEFNRSFDAKRRAFARSALLMAREVAEDYEEWGPQAVTKRSRDLARAAATTWGFVRRPGT